MKVKVTKQELRECITHAVIRALNESRMEEGFDEGKQITHPHALSIDELNALMDSDPDLAMAYLMNGRNMSQARKAAMADMSADSSMNGSDDEESTEEVDRGETPYLDAPEMPEDEIDNLVSGQKNDERIKGVYDGENYFPRGSKGYVVAFRKWIQYRNANADVDNGDHEGEWGYRPKDVSPKDWEDDPRNHGRMFRDMAKKKSQYGNVGDTMHVNTADMRNAGGGDF